MKVSTRENRNRLTHPIPEADQRCIVWETQRNAEDEISRLDPSIKAEVDALPQRQKEALMKALAVRNGAVVSFNPVLTQCLGSNTAAYLLGSEEQARAALFYLVKYMNKDSVPLGNSLPVIRQALLHVNTYDSMAVDRGTISRTGKYFLERIVNGFTGLAEISDTQSAACLLGMKSYMSTEAHWFMFIKGAEAYQHEMQLKRHSNVDPGLAWEDESDIEARSDDDTDNQSAEEEILEMPGAVDDSECDDLEEQGVRRGRGRFGRAQPEIFNVNGRPVAVSQHTHYRFRGIDLMKLNFYEWSGMIAIKEKESAEVESRLPAAGNNQSSGAVRRPKNGAFEFAVGHPLRGTHIQKLRSKFMCPVFAGGGPPKYPGHRTSSRGAQWKKKADVYARYMLTAFNPWCLVDGSAWDHHTYSKPWDAFCAMCNKLDPHPDSEMWCHSLTRVDLVSSVMLQEH